MTLLRRISHEKRFQSPAAASTLTKHWQKGQCKRQSASTFYAPRAAPAPAATSRKLKFRREGPPTSYACGFNSRQTVRQAMTTRELLNSGFFWEAYPYAFQAMGIPAPDKSLFLDLVTERVQLLIAEIDEADILKLPLKIEAFFGERYRLHLRGKIVTLEKSLEYSGHIVWMSKLNKFRGTLHLATGNSNPTNGEWDNFPREIQTAKFVEYNRHLMIEGWPERIQQAQLELQYLINDEKWSRIPYGDEREEWGNELPSYCGDCGVLEGQLHVPGCDLERCPVCLAQSISCDCIYSEENAA